MGIVAKNIVIGATVVTPEVPVKQKQRVSWNEIRTFQEKPVVTETVIKEDKPKYHEVHDGELHKLINTKSSYLSDMTGFKK